MATSLLPVRLVFAAMVSVLWLALRIEATVVLSTSGTYYSGQLANHCSAAYGVEITADTILAMTFNPPVCRAFFGGEQGTQCSDANELSNSHTATGSGTYLFYVNCTSTGSITWTITGASGSSDSKVLSVYDFSAPISSDIPLVLYENRCTAVSFAVDREVVVTTSPLPSVSVEWRNQGSCFMYSDSCCANKVSSATMVSTVGVGTSVTAYFKCASAIPDVTRSFLRRVDSVFAGPGLTFAPVVFNTPHLPHRRPLRSIWY